MAVIKKTYLFTDYVLIIKRTNTFTLFFVGFLSLISVFGEKNTTQTLPPFIRSFSQNVLACTRIYWVSKNIHVIMLNPLQVCRCRKIYSYKNDNVFWKRYLISKQWKTTYNFVLFCFLFLEDKILLYTLFFISTTLTSLYGLKFFEM